MPSSGATLLPQPLYGGVPVYIYRYIICINTMHCLLYTCSSLWLTTCVLDENMLLQQISLSLLGRVESMLGRVKWLTETPGKALHIEI